MGHGDVYIRICIYVYVYTYTYRGGRGEGLIRGLPLGRSLAHGWMLGHRTPYKQEYLSSDNL